MADEFDPKLGFGGPNGPKRKDGGTFKYTPFALVSDKNDSNKITREYFDSFVLNYKFIDAKTPDMKTNIFGIEFPSPIIEAGMSAVVTRLKEGGMPDLALGAKAVNTIMMTGYISEKEIEDVVNTGVKAIRILKPQADNEVIKKDIQHDEKCGCFAYAIDVDHAFGPNGYPCPKGGPDYGDLAPKSVAELKDLIASSKLPCIIKGVLSVDDALKAVEAGASAILLSHHKGELPDACPPLMVLPEIKAAVGNKIAIWIDCGITSGIDAFKALSLGADVVCVGRTLIPSYIDAGHEGVANRFKQLNDELRACMARTCTYDVSCFRPDSLRKRNF